MCVNMLMCALGMCVCSYVDVCICTKFSTVLKTVLLLKECSQNNNTRKIHLGKFRAERSSSLSAFSCQPSYCNLCKVQRPSPQTLSWWVTHYYVVQDLNLLYTSIYVQQRGNVPSRISMNSEACLLLGDDHYHNQLSFRKS